MRMKRLYYELDAEDRKVYCIWLRKIIALWALMLAAVLIVCTVLALDTSTTPEQRIAPFQQSGAFP